MRNYIIAAALALAVQAGAEEPKAAEPAKSEASQPAGAAAKIGASLRTWFLNLKEGLSESSVSGQRQKGRLTSVAAVRGNAQGSDGGRSVSGLRPAQRDASEADRPAWKSGAQSKKMKQLRLEKAEFSAAVDLILDGKLQQGSEALDAFEQAHPGSSLLAEVQETRGKIKEAQAAHEQVAGGVPAAQ